MGESGPFNWLTLSSQTLDGTTTMLVSGELDIATTGQLRARFEQVLTDDKPARIILDMRAVTFIAAAGIGLLSELSDMAARHDSVLLLGEVSPVVTRLLTIVGLAGHYPSAALSG
jgi:anti-sigma B factor antagonist